MNSKALLTLVAVLLIGGGVALAIGGGDDDDGPAAPKTEASTSSQPKPTEEKTDAQDKAEVSDEEEVAAAVADYIDQAEAGGSVECDLVVDEVCVQDESTIDLAAVQGFLGELEVAGVQVDGDRASAQLERGGSFQLRQQDGEWRIAGFEPALPERRGGADGDTGGTGGAEAPGTEGPGAPAAPDAPERPKPELPASSGGAEAP